ncbi:MAG: T9SS type A sorting domain-containing protein [Bacteroidetes bacterium]|nr:T9SS type A sorting domain-containing protein [Bacteroidota bacterium]
MKHIKRILTIAVVGVFILSLVFVIKQETPVGDINTINEKPVATKEFKHATKALYNAEVEYMKTRNPETGQVPACIRANELDFASILPVNERTERNQNWVHRGPVNMGGRMLCVAFDVEDENHMLAGSASGGMWQSMNQGDSWEKVTPANGEQSATCIAQDTRAGKTNVWYYGTGEILNTTERNVSTNVRTIGVGNGIFKSTDNGNSWQPLESTMGGNQSSLEDVFQGIWKIVTDPVTIDKDIVYAACYGAIMRSEDGGETWAITLGDLSNKSFATDIAITSEGVIFAALSTYSTSIMRPLKAGIWRSEDGLNWSEITPDGLPDVTRVMKLAIAPSNENVVYLITEKPSEIHVPYSGIFNSDLTFWKYTYFDDLETGIWEERTETMYGHGKGDFLSYPNALITYGGYTLELAVKPDNENVVFMGGMSLFRSNNGFADSLQTTWMGGDPFDMDSIHMLHPDQHGFAFLPSNPDVFFAACDGGIIATEDCMAENIHWERKNNNLITSQFYSVTIDRAGDGDNWILGGLQDNNWYYSVTDDPGQWWFSVDLYYDGFSCKLANFHEYAIVAAYSGNIWTTRFAENMHTQNIYYQTPDTLLSYYDPTIGSNPAFPFYCNFALDPNNNSTFYLPTINSIWRKDNMMAAASDTSLRNVGWNRLNNINLSESVQITALTLSTNPANMLFYGTNDGHIYKMENAHTEDPHPVEITGDYFPLNAYISCIDVNLYDANKVFTVFSNYGIKSIYYSEDGGNNWMNVSGNLEEYPDGTGAGPSVRWVKSLNYNGGTAYFAGTSVGLYSTTVLNGDETNWKQEGHNNIGTIMVDMIDTRETDGFVAIATQGNGMYSTYFDPSLSVSELQNSRSVKLRNFPNPSQNQTTIEYELSSTGNVSLNLMDMNGRLIKHLFTSQQQKGVHAFQMDVTGLSPGIYIIKLQVDNSVEYCKMIKK